MVRLHGQGASRASLAAGLPLVQGRLTLELTQRAAARAGMVTRLTRVALAEDNYVQHKVASSQIGSRVRAGVGRGVDLEQSNARLALAESNLVTETANLHDVTARYARIVGELPPARVAKAAPSNAGLPASAADAGNAAVQASPAISAAIESLRAARASAKGREGSAWQPRVEARLCAAARAAIWTASPTRGATPAPKSCWNGTSTTAAATGRASARPPTS